MNVDTFISKMVIEKKISPVYICNMQQAFSFCFYKMSKEFGPTFSINQQHTYLFLSDFVLVFDNLKTVL